MPQKNAYDVRLRRVETGDEAPVASCQSLSTPLFLQIGRQRFQIETLKQASERFCMARDASGNGASRTPSPLIVDENGNTVGYVSYNGRVWPGTPQNWQPGIAPLYDNAAAA